jgi:hypothetical protein
MRMIATVVLASVLTVLIQFAAVSDEATWTRVGAGMKQGVSGIAPGSNGGWVVVRDNKVEGDNRVALLSSNGVATPLTWPGAPVDLEAIDVVPGRADEYAVVTSAGAGRVISISGTTLKVGRAFTLPTGRSQNEGFALTHRDGTTVAVWGNRGSVTAPGRLFTATFNPSTGVFGPVTKAEVRVPYPTAHVRHISDLRVMSDGRIVISSASDPGTSGPFASALYDVGTVNLVKGRARLSPVTPVLLGRVDGHKVEGIGCAGTTGLLGADDEKLGGWVSPSTICPD